MSGSEDVIASVYDWKGFEKFGAVSTDPITSGAFTSRTTTGGTNAFQSGAADSADPYGTGFGLRTPYNGSGSCNVIQSVGVKIPGYWKRIFLRSRIRVATNAVTSGNKHELMALRDSSGNALFGVQWERTVSGLHFRQFIGHPTASGHPAGSTSYTAGTQTTNRATNTWFDVLVVAEAQTTGGNQTNLSLYVNGTESGSAINDSAFSGGPYHPNSFIAGGNYQVILGRFGMNTPPNTHNVHYDVTRVGVYPNLSVQSVSMGMMP